MLIRQDAARARGYEAFADVAVIQQRLLTFDTLYAIMRSAAAPSATARYGAATRQMALLLYASAITP